MEVDVEIFSSHDREEFLRGCYRPREDQTGLPINSVLNIPLTKVIS